MQNRLNLKVASVATAGTSQLLVSDRLQNECSCWDTVEWLGESCAKWWLGKSWCVAVVTGQGPCHMVTKQVEILLCGDILKVCPVTLVELGGTIGERRQWHHITPGSPRL